MNSASRIKKPKKLSEKKAHQYMPPLLLDSSHTILELKFHFEFSVHHRSWAKSIWVHKSQEFGFVKAMNGKNIVLKPVQSKPFRSAVDQCSFETLEEWVEWFVQEKTWNAIINESYAFSYHSLTSQMALNVQSSKVTTIKDPKSFGVENIFGDIKLASPVRH